MTLDVPTMCVTEASVRLAGGSQAGWLFRQHELLRPLPHDIAHIDITLTVDVQAVSPRQLARFRSHVRLILPES